MLILISVLIVFITKLGNLDPKRDEKTIRRNDIEDAISTSMLKSIFKGFIIRKS